MPVWAVLLRGINVGGHHKVPMAELRQALADHGFADVTTYIASGNIVVRAERCEPAVIRGIIADRFGLDIEVMVRSADGIRAAAAANPFPDLVDQPARLFCGFTSDPVGVDDLVDFDHGRYAPDRVATAAGEVYIHYADGAGRSKLTNAVIDRAAGTTITARNWNTVLKLVELVGMVESSERRAELDAAADHP